MARNNRPSKRLLIVLILVLAVGVAVADTTLPCFFYGGVTMSSVPAPPGTVIVARTNGETRGQTTVTTTGQYGNSAPLMVTHADGDPPGAVITFFVNGVQAPQTGVFQEGAATRIDLSIGVTPPPTPSPSLTPTRTPTPTPTITPSPTSTPDPAVLKAAFYADTKTGDLPLIVFFHDLSTGGPTKWYWTFGDGATSSEQHPVHTYVKDGEYTVKLKVSNPSGANSLSRSNYITVSNGPVPTPTSTASPTPTPVPTATPAVTLTSPPSHTTTPTPTPTITTSPTTDSSVLKAAFNADPKVGALPLVVSFRDRSTGSPTMWYWTFGDGTTSNEQNPTHTYVKAGGYSVKLKVTNSFGTSGLSRSGYVTVLNGTVPSII